MERPCANLPTKVVHLSGLVEGATGSLLTEQRSNQLVLASSFLRLENDTGARKDCWKLNHMSQHRTERTPLGHIGGRRGRRVES